MVRLHFFPYSCTAKITESVYQPSEELLAAFSSLSDPIGIIKEEPQDSDIIKQEESDGTSSSSSLYTY